MTIDELAGQVGILAKMQVEALEFIGSLAERHEREMSDLRQAQIATERSIVRLSETVERFITRGGNGH